jgi:hypothetical protein
MKETQMQLFEEKAIRIDHRIGCENKGPIPKPFLPRCGLFEAPRWVNHYVIHLKPFNRRHASDIDYLKMKYVEG